MYTINECPVCGHVLKKSVCAYVPNMSKDHLIAFCSNDCIDKALKNSDDYSEPLLTLKDYKIGIAHE